MDGGQSLIISPLFDGTNYAYWKVRVRVFLQSLDEKVWQAIEIGWTKPIEVSVTNEEFKKISSIEIAKEAWTILPTTYEGTKVVKDLKL